MGYGYAYSYGITSGLIGAQVYAGSQTTQHIQRVLADGGIVQNQAFVYDFYKLAFELGGLAGDGPLQIRRVYDALAGVKLNNVAGTDYVQTMYDFGTTSDLRVDALQTTAANQPLWSTDAELPTGVRAPRYDGTDDFMSIGDLGIYNGQTVGSLMAVGKDTNRTAGSPSHYLISATTSGGLGRATIASRLVSVNNFATGGRRQDADSLVSSGAASSDGLHHFYGAFVWGGNLLQGTFDGVASASTTFSSGGGTTSLTDSTSVQLGALAGASVITGLVTSAMLNRIVLTSDQNAAFRTLYKGYYPVLP